MSRTYGLRTSKDLLAKLERDAQLLQEEVSSDRFFNFVVTAYSLVDWIGNDPAVPASAKTALTQFRHKSEIEICRELANASKHFQLDPRRYPNPMVASSDSEQGFGVGRYGVGGFGIGEEEITVFLSAGTSVNGLRVMEDALREWKTFFQNHAI